MRTLAMPKAAGSQWSLNSLRDKLINIGAKRYQPRPLRHLPVWPRSRYRGRCSRTSWCSSPGCGHRLRRH